MARIKFVLNERRLALIEAQQQARLDGETQPEEDDGERSRHGPPPKKLP